MARRFRFRPGNRFERIVIGTIAALALVAFLVTEAQSERLAMTLAVRNMRSGLQWAIAEHLVRGKDNRMGELVGANPIEFLGRSGETAKLSSRWRFDAQHQEVVYRPLITLAFGGSSELRWRVVGRTEPDGRVADVRLVEVPPRAD